MSLQESNVIKVNANELRNGDILIGGSKVLRTEPAKNNKDHIKVYLEEDLCILIQGATFLLARGEDAYPPEIEKLLPDCEIVNARDLQVGDEAIGNKTWNGEALRITPVTNYAEVKIKEDDKSHVLLYSTKIQIKKRSLKAQEKEKEELSRLRERERALLEEIAELKEGQDRLLHLERLLGEVSYALGVGETYFGKSGSLEGYIIPPGYWNTLKEIKDELYGHGKEEKILHAWAGSMDNWIANGPSLCKENGVKEVKITDICSEYNVDFYYFGKESSYPSTSRFAVPDDIFDLLSGVEKSQGNYKWKEYKTKGEADRDFSNACITWAKNVE